ncbi:MAG: carbohydrate binding domain-containing protein [Sedimentisphaerales bacterium]|nr:carbohydrate binding domain-containing protein [Sedimentisphaerales bacterium]
MRSGSDRRAASQACNASFSLSVIAVVLSGFACPAHSQDFVPFVIPARVSPELSIWVASHDPIKTDSDRLAATDHFYRRNAPVRIWGVNLCFGANFPTHEDAPYVAQRLAAAGVNAIRCHHLDTSRWPNGIWNAIDGRTIEPQALDRLDYFINELASRGIWVNLNLHVGRSHSQYLGAPTTNSDYDKISGIFTPALISAQKQYARDLLTHVNPYRGVRYADDPAIAFVEITNEDSFFMWNGDDTLRTLPRYYGQILRDKYNDWLRSRYGSDEALRAAWAQDTQPLGANMLQNGTFTQWNKGIPRYWNLEQHEGCQASLSQPRSVRSDAMQVKISKADAVEWHLQFNQSGLAVIEGQYYTLSFEASSERPRKITAYVGQAHDPWGNLGVSRTVDMGDAWRKFNFGFVASASDGNARVSFSFSGDSTTFNLSRVELRPGGQTVLAEGESLALGNVGLFQESESQRRILDRMVFLAETEKAYFDSMRSYIRTDLGCSALVTGTIVFGPLGLYAQSDMDYIDSHSYWQHPTFPGRPWDPADWLIEQKPMTDYPEQATLFRIAAERLAGKPFTLSEYNHPAPLDAQAECVPMIASFAAAQDWDGIWLFDYSGSANAWSRETMSGFFDIDTNPGKWGFMRAGAAMFRDSCVSPLNSFTRLSLTEGSDVLSQLAALHLKHGSDMLGAVGVSREAMLTGRHVAALNGEGERGDIAGPGAAISWTVENGKGMYAVQSGAAWIYVGHAERFSQVSGGRITVAAPEFVALTVTGLDGDPSTLLENHTKILVTVCGRCENIGMQFSPDRRTVGRNWGTAPVQIEAVRGSVILPQGRWTCHALAPDGSSSESVPIVYDADRGTLTLSPGYGTMWYLLEQNRR